MYSDPDYLALDQLSLQLTNQILPNADLHYLLNLNGQITQAQFVYTVQQLGFTDTTAFRTFQKKQIPYQQRLHAKYFSGSNPPPSISMTQVSPMYPDKCTAAYNGCIHTASHNYTYHIIECTGAAVGFAAVGAGIGGLIFQLGCGAYSIHVLNEDRQDCVVNYQACQNN
jgi:hypothetical protein